MAWPRRPSLTMLVLALFTVYVAHTVRTLYHVVHTEPCLSGSRCFASYLQAKPSLQLSIFTSLQARNVEIDKLNLVLTIEDFDPHADILKELNVPLPRGMRPRGSLYAHTFVHAPGLEPWHDERAQHAVASLTTLMVPKSEEVNLVARNKNDKPGPKKLMAHWRSHLSLNLMTDNFLFDLKALPGDVLPYFKISPMDRNLYLPMLFVDQLSNRVKDLILVNDSTVTLPLRLSYTPISLSKLRLWVHMQQALHTLQDLGFSEKDGDEVKGIFADTNLYFLGLTFLVATFHLLFDFLAFKNDISFWKAKRDMVGMSIRAVSWRCFSTFVLFLFLLDEQTSLLVLIPAGVGSIIEAWKVTKAFKIQIRWTGKLPRIQVGTSSVNERQTEQFDSEAMKYLSYALYPLCLGSAMYSLLYVQHKSWYSWVINSLVNGIYAFGFLFMLPQLFVNYRLKSVAHLPWKAFMYKAFNTFIDDVFAFIITMPTSHRLACFRDDVVFLIYLYQRWLFPVDKSRMNEYGASYEDEPQKRSNKAKNKVS